jgi:hypothetical protein
MSWLDPQNDDDERMRNLLIYKMYLTDKERDETGATHSGRCDCDFRDHFTHLRRSVRVRGRTSKKSNNRHGNSSS